jgi:hypothetical protein
VANSCFPVWSSMELTALRSAKGVVVLASASIAFARVTSPVTDLTKVRTVTLCTFFIIYLHLSAYMNRIVYDC